MDYSIKEEYFGEKLMELDGEGEQHLTNISKLVSDKTNIEYEKVYCFMKNLGVIDFFRNPFLLGVSKEQEKIISDLQNIIYLDR